MHGLHGALTARAAGGSAPVRAGRADSPEGIWKPEKGWAW
ncbi:hypothetical protein Ga0080559_TMP2218 [Salipiger profundus]|uniref:Uncharacterized protein n=1 Tax=Salipiger profundus TaxID=1229727 RepID=A0A1U7D4C4_9RHOB|nr:hypothetical protein Ga0080559_TMP2218 [Salipiger profundus]SFD21321.1 hypothetical protein SAMN05444415_108209 [Salipiger profundus]